MNRHHVPLGFLVIVFFTSLPASAQTRYPVDVAVDEKGTVFIADRDLPGIWTIETDQLAQYFAGSKKFRTPLNAVRCLAIDNAGLLLAGDTSTREIYRFDKDRQPTGLTGGRIGIPMGIAATKSGDLLVSDLELQRIWRVPASGGEPVALAEVPAPRGVCLDLEGQLLVVSHGKDGQLLRVAADGQVTTVVAGRPFEFPHDVAVAADGTIHVSDGYAKAIWTIRKGAKPEKWVSGAPLVNPIGLAWRGTDLLVVDPRANAVFRIDAAGKISPLIEGRGTE
jgi:hypothetical protein